MLSNAEKDSGFTLIELLVAITLAVVLSVAIFNTFLSQNKSHSIQEQVTGMQQNLRAALLMMVKEIRMAGYDPQGTAGATIVTGSINSIYFQSDNDGDGTCHSSEDITYSFDGTNFQIRRDTSGDNQTIAEDIENLEFLYTLESGGAPVTSAADPNQIRVIQVTILARSEYEDPDFTNTMNYTTASGASWGPYNDGFRRRLLMTTIKCRNMGL